MSLDLVQTARCLREIVVEWSAVGDIGQVCKPRVSANVMPRVTKGLHMDPNRITCPKAGRLYPFEWVTGCKQRQSTASKLTPHVWREAHDVDARRVPAHLPHPPMKKDGGGEGGEPRRPSQLRDMDEQGPSPSTDRNRVRTHLVPTRKQDCNYKYW